MQYQFKGMNSDGKIVRGTVESTDIRSARQLVKHSNQAEVVLEIQKSSNIKQLNQFMEKRLVSLAESENKKREKQMKKELEKTEKKESAKDIKNPFMKPLPSLKDLKLPSFGKSNKKKSDFDPENISEEGMAKLQQIFTSIKNAGERDEVSFDEQVVDYEKKLDLEEKVRNKLREKVGEKEVNWEVLSTSKSLMEQNKKMKTGKKLKIKQKEIFLFTRRLQIMLSSGVSLLSALMKIQKNSSPNMSKVSGEIINKIQSGSSFSEALGQYPAQFNQVYVALVQVGESSGSLDRCLLDILDIQEQQMVIKKKIKSATVYPIIIGVVLLAMLILGSVYFIPNFESLFSDQGMELPMLTKVVFGAADMMPALMGGAALTIALLVMAKKRYPAVDRFWKKHWHKLLLKTPVVKSITNASYMFTFSSTIALMLNNGIRLKDALALTYRAIDNVHIKNAIIDASGLMIRGESFSEALAKQKEFDDIMIQIVETGEESGRMTFALEQVTKYFKEDLDRQISVLLEMVQPVSMILVGLLAGPVIIAVYLPILDMSGGALGI